MVRLLFFAGVGAILLAVLYRKFSWKMLYESALETVKVMAMVFAILLGDEH